MTAQPRRAGRTPPWIRLATRAARPGQAPETWIHLPNGHPMPPGRCGTAVPGHSKLHRYELLLDSSNWNPSRIDFLSFT